MGRKSLGSRFGVVAALWGTQPAAQLGDDEGEGSNDGPIPSAAEGSFPIPRLGNPKPTRVSSCPEEPWSWDTPPHVQHPVQIQHFQTRKKKKAEKNSSDVRRRGKITPKTYLTPHLAPLHQGSSRASSLASQGTKAALSTTSHPAIHKTRAQQKTHMETSTHTSTHLYPEKDHLTHCSLLPTLP